MSSSTYFVHLLNISLWSDSVLGYREDGMGPVDVQVCVLDETPNKHPQPRQLLLAFVRESHTGNTLLFILTFLLKGVTRVLFMECMWMLTRAGVRGK